MTDQNSENTLFVTRPEGLARILDDDSTDLWSPDEMKAMWRHQLSAPMDVDLAGVTSVRATTLRQSPHLAGFKGRTFTDLFSMPEAPVELLELTKEFAKDTLKQAEEKQLKEIASALYYAAYAAGLLRHQKLIGSMKQDELKPGFSWAIKLSWLDEETRQLIGKARDLIGAGAK